MGESISLGALFEQYGKGSSLETLEPDTYDLEVASVKVRETATNKDLFPTYKVVSGPHQGKRIAAGYLSFKGDGPTATMPRLIAMGLTKEFFDVATSLQEVADALKGRVIRVALQAEPYQGEARNRLPFAQGIKLISVPAGSGSTATVPVVTQAVPAAAPAEAVPAVAAVPALPVTTAAPPPVPAAAAPAVTTDDDPGF